MKLIFESRLPILPGMHISTEVIKLFFIKVPITYPVYDRGLLEVVSLSILSKQLYK